MFRATIAAIAATATVVTVATIATVAPTTTGTNTAIIAFIAATVTVAIRVTEAATSTMEGDERDDEQELVVDLFPSDENGDEDENALESGEFKIEWEEGDLNGESCDLLHDLEHPKTHIELIKQFLDDKFFNFVIEQSNLYASQKNSTLNWH